MKARAVGRTMLTQLELEFLEKHDISVDEVIDVTGMIAIGQKRAMEAKGARLALNGKYCRSGHRFKTRSNHCPQCDTKNLAFERRFDETAYVYVAVSGSGLVKIGFSFDPNDRIQKLNHERYGSCENWRLVHSVSVRRAGNVESDAHRLLANRAVSQSYHKNNVSTYTYELFMCTLEEAIDAVTKASEGKRLLR